jgi:hypothetical protein
MFESCKPEFWKGECRGELFLLSFHLVLDQRSLSQKMLARFTALGAGSPVRCSKLPMVNCCILSFKPYNEGLHATVIDKDWPIQAVGHFIMS